MSNTILVACGVFAAAAVSIFVRARRRSGGDSGILEEDGPVGRRLPIIDLDDDEAAEIISRARPALDRAAKLL